MWKWQLVLSALATFTTAFAAPMPSVTIDVQKVDETIEPVPRIARFDYEAKDGLLLRNGKPFFWTSDGASLLGVPGAVIITHGSSSHKAIYYAVKAGVNAARNDVSGLISSRIEEYETSRKSF